MVPRAVSIIRTVTSSSADFRFCSQAHGSQQVWAVLWNELQRRQFLVSGARHDLSISSVAPEVLLVISCLGHSWLTLISACRSLLCIPLSAVILDHLGTQGFVIVFGVVLLIALAAFTMARLAIQGYVWRWAHVV